MTIDTPAKGNDKAEETTQDMPFHRGSLDSQDMRGSGEFNYTKLASATAAMVEDRVLPNFKTSC